MDNFLDHDLSEQFRPIGTVGVSVLGERAQLLSLVIPSIGAA
jgi:hypothetical protein